MTDTAPPWLATMRQITGTSAQNDNAVILEWAKKIGELYSDTESYCAGYTNDTIPWCGLTVGYCMAVNNIKPVFGATDTDKFFYALAWQQFGTVTDTPQQGDVLVFDFGGGDHHVTLLEQVQADAYICRGGNQSHEVKVSSYPKSQCIGMRRPPVAAAGAQPVAPATPVQLFTGITATEFGGTSDPNTSAYDGHLIDDIELGVALPARFSGTRPRVQVWSGSKSVVCNIVDIGPWNTNDPYWQSGARPQAETGTDMRGRPTNKAGIDLTPAAARAIGVPGKGTVSWGFLTAPAPLPVPVQPQPPTPPAPPSAPDQVATLIQQLLAQLETLKMPATPALPSTPATPTTPSTPATQPDLPALLQQVAALMQTLNTQSNGTVVASQLPDQIKQITDLLTVLSGGQPALGQVNGALGQTIGNLLNGKKSAIGIIGSMLTAILQAAGPTIDLSKLTPLLGTGTLGTVAMPIFLAITAWGILGKLEKWAQGSVPISAAAAG